MRGHLVPIPLDAIAEPARGGYRRYFGWTLALLPVPAEWSSARKALAAIGRRAREGHVPEERELLEAAAAAYGIRVDDVAPLVTWMSA